MSQPSQVMTFIASPQEDFAWSTGQPLRGLNIKWKDDTVLLIVKTWDKRGNPIIAFIECDTLIQCYEYLYEYLHKFNVPLKWKPDQYA